MLVLYGVAIVGLSTLKRAMSVIKD